MPRKGRNLISKSGQRTWIRQEIRDKQRRLNQDLQLVGL